MRFSVLAASLLGGAALVTSALAGAPAAVGHAGAGLAFDPMHVTNHSVAKVRGFNQNGYNWSGYAATGSGFSSVSASWTEPSVTCNSTNDLMAPWVGIDGYGSSSVEQTGVETDCSSGRPVYAAWYEMYPANPVYYSNSVSAGDVINASVTRSGSSYSLVLSDTTKGWTKTTNKSYNGANSSAEAIIESPTAAYPKFGTVHFTNVKINGQSLSNYGPVALDASNNSGYEDHTSAISGGTAFSIAYEHE